MDCPKHIGHPSWDSMILSELFLRSWGFGDRLKLRLSFSWIQKYPLNTSSTSSTREGLDKDEKETDCLNLYGVHIIMEKNMNMFYTVLDLLFLSC